MRPFLFLVYTSILIITLGGCPRIDNIEEINELPVIIFNELEGTYSFQDSIKISLKSPQKDYDVRLRLVDVNNNLAFLVYELLAGQGSLFLNGSPIEENSPINLVPGENVLELVYEPTNAGMHTLEFIATDDFDERTTFSLELEAFINLPPIAVFGVETPQNPSDPLERVLDASDSFDRDQKFGGEILVYEFTVLGKVITVESSSIPIIFPSEDDYTITVRVMDNDGDWSDLMSKRVKIE